MFVSIRTHKAPLFAGRHHGVDATGVFVELRLGQLGERFAPTHRGCFSLSGRPACQPPWFMGWERSSNTGATPERFDELRSMTVGFVTVIRRIFIFRRT
jgi:hypothetical protein